MSISQNNNIIKKLKLTIPKNKLLFTISIFDIDLQYNKLKGAGCGQ